MGLWPADDLEHDVALLHRSISYSLGCKSSLGLMDLRDLLGHLNFCSISSQSSEQSLWLGCALLVT